MKVLILGGMGFIGSHLSRKNVDLGNEVFILTRSRKKEENIKEILDRVNLIIKDIRDISEEDVKGMDIIYHLAGTVDNYSINNNPYYDIQVNCNGTIALLEAVRKYNPSAKILYASTFFVNGNLDHLPANEQSPCNPLGLYGATRLAGEHFCKVYTNLFGLNVKIARFTNVFGPYEQGENKKKAGFNYLINLAVNEKELGIYKGGDFIRDYIYVDDVVEGCIKIIENGDSSKIYYISRGEKIKFKFLIDMINKRIPGLKTKDVFPPVFHQKIGIKDFYADNSELTKLGWKPQVSLEEGIKRTIEFYQSRKT